jgi:hypothetical protein
VAASGVRGARDRGLLTTIGGCGLGAVVLTFVPAVANSGEEQSFDGSAGAVVAYLRATSTPIAQLGSAVMTLGIVALLVFLTSVAVLLHRAGTEPSWRPAVVATCAAAFGGIVLTSSSQAAARQAPDVHPASPSSRSARGTCRSRMHESSWESRPSAPDGRPCARGLSPGGSGGGQSSPARSSRSFASTGRPLCGSSRTPHSGCGSSPCRSSRS